VPRWPESLPVSCTLSSLSRTGLTLDRIGLPEPNPWRRRVRTADIAFLDQDRAAVVTFDGDVWLVEGLADAALARVRWRRYASGLSEPLAIAVVQGVVQVATRNGVIRLHDRGGRGEADWYENFCDLAIQSHSSRAFSLDMDVGPDGSTYVTQGGIGNEGTSRKPVPSSASGEHQGTVLKIAPDGRSLSVFSRGGREPYVTVDPVSGVVTGSDQQGHFVPSSVCYLIRPGAEFGFGDEKPAKLTPPLAWIPHSEDSSSSSGLWIRGAGMGPFDGSLLHLSYGTGQPFLICPDLSAPIPQGAVIPLGFKTDVPLLQGRMHPSGAAAYLCGFQIYDSRARTMWGIARLRRDARPVTIPIAARSCAQGVILSFAAPVDPASVNVDQVTATAWNYKRSPNYGSGRFAANGAAGTDRLTVNQVVLSQDRRSVFVHLSDLAPVMQLEIRFTWTVEGVAPANDGTKDPGVVYFTIHQPQTIDLAAAGFPGVDLTRRVLTTQVAREEPPSVKEGEVLSQTMGCTACHALGANQEGKTGPTWKGLFGRLVTCTDGTTVRADDAYIRESILDPDKRIVQGYPPGMATYRGVLTDNQIDSVILYIRSLP
jgi:cytochrome c2